MKTVVIWESKTYRQMPPQLYEDDVGVQLNFQIKTNADAVVDITGYTITFKIKDIDSATNKISAGCTIDTAASGTCHYTFTGTDLDADGVYDAELQLVNGSITNTIKLGRFTILSDLP